MEKVSELKSIYFNNKGESEDNREIGVIAQDVDKSTAGTGFNE